MMQDFLSANIKLTLGSLDGAAFLRIAPLVAVMPTTSS